MREEIAGEPPEEELEEMVVEKVVEQPEVGGVTLKFPDIHQLPEVSVVRT